MSTTQAITKWRKGGTGAKPRYTMSQEFAKMSPVEGFCVPAMPRHIPCWFKHHPGDAWPAARAMEYPAAADTKRHSRRKHSAWRDSASGSVPRISGVRKVNTNGRPAAETAAWSSAILVESSTGTPFIAIKTSPARTPPSASAQPDQMQQRRAL